MAASPYKLSKVPVVFEAINRDIENPDVGPYWGTHPAYEQSRRRPPGPCAKYDICGSTYLR